MTNSPLSDNGTVIEVRHAFQAAGTGWHGEVNLPTAGIDFHVPFGGIKGSSYGPREQGSYAAEIYTAVKKAYTAMGE